jgi:hypothetical protein
MKEQFKHTRSASNNTGPSQASLRQEARASFPHRASSTHHKPYHHVPNPQSRSQTKSNRTKNWFSSCKYIKREQIFWIENKYGKKERDNKKDIFDEEFGAASSLVRVASLLYMSVRTLSSHFSSDRPSRL